MSGGLTRVIEKVLLIETGQRVSVSDSRLHAYPGKVQRLAVIPAEVLTGRPGNLREAPLKGVEVLVRPVGQLNAKESRDPQSRTMPSAALITGDLSERQANVGLQAARAVVESAVVEESAAVDTVVESEGNLTVIINSIYLTRA